MIGAAFILGLLGSWHCVGMCGPIAMIVPGAQGKNRIYSILLYHSGKTLSYVLIGSLFGLFGVFLSSLKVQSVTTIIVGIIMILLAFLPVILSRLEKGGFKLFSSYFQLKSKLTKMLEKDKLEFSFYIGILNGFIPCGLVYTAAIAALAQSSAAEGALFMLAFGLGTAPFLSLIIFASDFIKNKMRSRASIYRTLAFCLVGGFMLWKGLNAYQIEIDSAKQGDHFQICQAPSEASSL